MKVFIITLIIVLCFSCHSKDQETCETPIVGSFNSDSNYPNWDNSSCFYTINNGKINLSFNSLDNLCNREQFEIVSIAKSIGEVSKLHSEITSPIKDGFTIFSELTGEDGVIGSFNIDNNYYNKVTILSIDNVKEEINGTFDLQFIPDSIHFPNSTEIFYFKNGKFTAKLVK